ncbi:MAG: SDR family oxidoreductase [Deltaproteobacteria bacterium]|nr:SDR family oxidoreductase [Deltaproteobacteria bacterium]
MRSALVLGGTGAVGSAVVRELVRREVATTFTFHASHERAAELATLGARAVAVDLADAGAIAAMLAGFDRDGFAPDLVIACAAVSAVEPFATQADAAWRACFAVNVDATAQVCRWFAGAERADRGGDIVLVGGLDRGQSLPLPVAYAASQGALAAMAMALGHELGPRGIRVNLVALGVLDSGMSQHLSSARRADYQRYSALRRLGTAAEAAKVITWLGLENAYIQGRVITANGGI